MNDLLNQYQRNALNIILRMFEQSLLDTLVILEGHKYTGVLYKASLDLADDRQNMARDLIHQALQEINVIAHKLSLQDEHENLADVVRAKMTLAWAELMSSQAKNMNGYGDVNPEAIKEIDPWIEHLAQIAIELADLFGRSSLPASHARGYLENI